jgi:hypothetical protein
MFVLLKEKICNFASRKNYYLSKTGADPKRLSISSPTLEGGIVSYDS